MVLVSRGFVLGGCWRSTHDINNIVLSYPETRDRMPVSLLNGGAICPQNSTIF